MSTPSPDLTSLSAAHQQWQSPARLRWSMQNIARFLPVRPIPRGTRTTAFGAAPQPLGAVPVPHPWGGPVRTFAEVMLATCTDGWIVTRDGAIIDEQYTAPMTVASLHLLMSVSKSLTCATVGALSGAGLVDVTRQVTDYVPALASSGYVGARVRDLVDMRTGIHFSEDYLDGDAEVRLLEEAIDWAPRRHATVPATLLGFLASLRADRPHGGRFDYKSCETDVLGFVIAGATGAHAADVISARLWQPMGAEQDAHVGVDSVAAPMLDGGVSAALRDLARFGTLYLHDGYALDGVPVLPPAWVADTLAGAADSREAFAASTEITLMDGGMYRNGFWFPRAGSDVLLALGIHGQMVYVNRRTRVVAAKVSTWPTPQDGEKLLSTIAAFDAVGAALA
ncbi:serine hydrolase domain-containing protein [Microbacterium luticocti]|uniref:serine hydrolase domain-containing protein n=1 Tax=Microbacterium luticocti TaxID=451764 RepID=UPI000421A7C6|nr:serine hydrolase [Microbacterium luticocti]